MAIRFAACLQPSSIGARNLGRSVIQRLVGDGWDVTGGARSAETLERVWAVGAHALEVDVTDRASVTGALEDVARRHGRVDLVVNAASPYGGDRSGPFGGGPLAAGGAGRLRGWSAAPAQAAFTFLSASARFLLDQGGEATVVQVTGGSSRRAMPGRGLWAAGAFGVRALTQAAALELREHRIHVALLIVDATIDRKETRRRVHRRPRRPRGRRRLPRVAGRAGDDARAPAHAGAGPVGAVSASRSRCTASRTTQVATWSLTTPHACMPA